MENLASQSPRKVDAALRVLLKYLELDETKIQLLKYSRPGSFIPETRECHLNALCQQRLHHGAMQHGWVLAQDRMHTFTEAIFHTVWQSPEGKLVDVTPRPDGEKRLMFVPDLKRKVRFTSHNFSPALVTFQNVKMLGPRIMSPISEMTIILDTELIQRESLWPWKQDTVSAVNK